MKSFAAPATDDLAGLDDAALQHLTATLIREVVSRIEASDGGMSALASREAITATEAMMFASALLKATDLAVFELGLWQSWGIGEQR